MRSPSRSASSRRLSTKSAAPSPMTKPSAPASKGRVPVADSAPILQNFTKAATPMLRSTPPVMTASIAVVDEAVHGRAQRGEARGAGRVGGEVGAAQVEQIGDAAGDDVGQFAGHRVFVDLGAAGEKGRARLFDDALALRLGHARQAGGLRQRAQHLGQLDAQVGAVVLLPADGVAEDHGHAVGVGRSTSASRRRAARRARR